MSKHYYAIAIDTSLCNRLVFLNQLPAFMATRNHTISQSPRRPITYYLGNTGDLARHAPWIELTLWIQEIYFNQHPQYNKQRYGEQFMTLASAVCVRTDHTYDVYGDPYSMGLKVIGAASTRLDKAGV